MPREYNDFQEAVDALKAEESQLVEINNQTHKQWDIEILALSSLSTGFMINAIFDFDSRPVLPILCFTAIGAFVLSIIVTLIGFSISAVNTELLIRNNSENLRYMLRIKDLSGQEYLAEKEKFYSGMDPAVRRATMLSRIIDFTNKARLMAFIAGALCAFCFFVLNAAVMWDV